jgi:xanthine/uracil permease
MDPSSVAGAGLAIGAFFLLLGASGVIGRVARVLPPTVDAGLQLGLGLFLAALGIRLVARPYLGTVRNRRRGDATRRPGTGGTAGPVKPGVVDLCSRDHDRVG